MMSSYTCVKCKNHGTFTWLNNLIHNVLMYSTELLWSGLTTFLPDSCVLGVNLTLLILKDTSFYVVQSIFLGDLR